MKTAAAGILVFFLGALILILRDVKLEEAVWEDKKLLGMKASIMPATIKNGRSPSMM